MSEEERVKRRPTNSSIPHYDARCQDCEWEQGKRNAVGLAAQHHDKTGHTVTIEVEKVIVFGDWDRRYDRI